MDRTVEIPLTKGFVAIIDEADLHLVSEYSWRVSQAGPNKFYAAASVPGSGGRRNVYMHRVIMGDPKGVLVDHEDNDGLNNRRNNLREADKSLNGANSPLSRRNKSGIKGVAWDADRRKWSASITVKGKVRHLGRFPTPDAAASAYETAARAAHGAFANPAHQAGVDAGKTICLFVPPRSY